MQLGGVIGGITGAVGANSMLAVSAAMVALELRSGLGIVTARIKGLT